MTDCQAVVLLRGEARPRIGDSSHPLFARVCRAVEKWVSGSIGNTVIETESFFIKQAAALWSAAELDDLKDYLARNPLAGDEMPGTGGLRKLRSSRAGMGKRGGARVIYYYYNETAPLYLFMAYAKAAQENPSPAAMAILAKLAEAAMAGIKAKRKEK
jgi:hypothetical protein